METGRRSSLPRGGSGGGCDGFAGGDRFSPISRWPTLSEAFELVCGETLDDDE